MHHLPWSDKLSDFPTVCPSLCAIQYPRHPSVTWPLCAALALVVSAHRVFTCRWILGGTELASPFPRWTARPLQRVCICNTTNKESPMAQAPRTLQALRAEDVMTR